MYFFLSLGMKLLPQLRKTPDISSEKITVNYYGILMPHLVLNTLICNCNENAYLILKVQEAPIIKLSRPKYSNKRSCPNQAKTRFSQLQFQHPFSLILITLFEKSLLLIEWTWDQDCRSPWLNPFGDPQLTVLQKKLFFSFLISVLP